MNDDYFKKTLAHSAPMLDGNCQGASQASGPAVVDVSETGDVHLAKLTSDTLYGEDKLRRTLFLIGDNDGSDEYPLILDVSQAVIQDKSAANHFFDVITHSESSTYWLAYLDDLSKQVSMSEVTRSMGDDSAWKYLTSLQQTDCTEAMKGTWDWSKNENVKGSNRVTGLEHFLPKVNHGRTTFYDLNAPSNAISNFDSKKHAVSIIRQSAINPIVQLLRPYTGNNFVLNFSQNGEEFTIDTTTETIRVNLGDVYDDTAPCATVTRKSKIKGTGSISHLACSSYELSDPWRRLSVSFFSRDGSSISLLQSSGSVPQFNSQTKTVVFNNVKLFGNKEIVVKVICCSGLHPSKLVINEQRFEAMGKKEISNNGMCITQSFIGKLKGDPFTAKSVDVAFE